LNDNPARGITLMLAATMLFACMDALSKHLAGHYSVPQILLIRFILFTLFALAIARPRSIRQAFRSHHPVLQLLRSVVITVEVGVFVLAFRHLPLADAHAIAGVAPLLVTALAVPFLGEKVGPRRWAAVGVGFIGLLVILRPGLTVMDPAAFIPLFGAFLWALYQILVRRVSADDASTSILYMAVVGLVTMSVIAPFFWKWPDLTGWIFLLMLGVIGSIGHYLLIVAFQMAPASTLQPFHYSLLVWATIVGYLVFNDFPDIWTISGGGLIVLSGIYTFYRERVRSQ